MSQPTGFTMPLSLPRRLINDYLHFAARVPTVPVQRRMNLAPLLAARQQAEPRPGWCALFTKAWAMVCAQRPAFRRAFLSWPTERIYQHPVSVASVAVERPYGDEEALFFMHVSAPDKMSVLDLDQRIRRFKDCELGSSGSMRRQLRICGLPRFLRRWIWWAGIHLGGRMRARYFGTFAVSSYASLGAASLHPISLLTSMLNYGVIDEDGGVDVRVIYDHRTMDGATVARALGDLERVLNNELVLELGYLKKLDAA